MKKMDGQGEMEKMSRFSEGSLTAGKADIEDQDLMQRVGCRVWLDSGFLLLLQSSRMTHRPEIMVTHGDRR